jgi:hypothetical protein
MSFALILIMLAMITVPAIFTLRTVSISVHVFPDQMAQSSPYGYTVSLLLFLVPIGTILGWLLPSERVKVSKKAFLWTVALLVPTGCLADYLFAHLFFTFPNKGAVLGVLAPARVQWVPVEEYVFYVTGFMAVLLLYIWMDEYWLVAYSVPIESKAKFERLLRFHPSSLIIAGVLIATAIVVRHFAAHGEAGFPGYFTYLVIVGLTPSVAFFPAAVPVVNWRACSLTLFFILLVSLLWEGSLASPYGWWGYQHPQMMGIYITAWNGLPVEAVTVWISVTYATVIVYEIIRRWKASDRPMRHAFLGAPAAVPPRKEQDAAV